MQFRQLPASGLQLSELGLGTWLSAASDRGVDCKQVVRRAFENGIRFFDTADVYVHGAAERALGEALADLDKSASVVSSKCFFPMSEETLNRGLSRKHILESVNASLKRLCVNALDIFFCHRFDPDTPLEETISALRDLIAVGKIHYWATSEWKLENIKRALDVSAKLGAPFPAADQYELNILNYGERRARARELAAMGLGAIAWSPLAGGLLTGKYGETTPQDSRFGAFQSLRRTLDPEMIRRASAFALLCRGQGFDPIHVALRFLGEDPHLTSILIGATRASHVDAACAALNGGYDQEIHQKVLEFVERAS